MFKYLLVLTAAATVIYITQNSQILDLNWSASRPGFKVWVSQSKGLGFDFDLPIVVLNIQSREDSPILVKRVLANDDPKCINTDQAQSVIQPMKLGQTLKSLLGVPAWGSVCNPVKVVVSTDRGEVVHHFD